jgi:hypothetical protein
MAPPRGRGWPALKIMKSKSDIEIKAGGGCSIRVLFGFVWDFRERQVNHLSFWYGFLQAMALCWIVRWAIDGIDAAFYWRAPMVLIVTTAAKWCQSRHDLKCDPNV